jgi:hypothetical protein
MPLPADFAAECLYAPDHWYVHDLLEAEGDVVRALVDTTRLGGLVDAQNATPGHPKHVPGAVMVQITGTLGNLHAVYVMGLRPTLGWSGFGTHVRSAKFPSLGKIGPPMEVELRVTRQRKLRSRHFVDYAFTYTQEGRQVYVSEQAAIWFHGPIAETPG